MSAGQPGQTGPLYTKRPSDLAAREAEAVATWKTTQLLPVELRSRAQFPVLTLAQSRAHLFTVLRWMNSRTEHRLEGFDEVVEWYDTTQGLWRNQNELSAECGTRNVECRTRMESPYERAAKLIRASLAMGEQFKRVSPDIIAAFFTHSQRFTTVTASGEIKIEHDRKTITFRPAGDYAVQPGTELLTHLNEEDPVCLYCTDGKGAMVGLWLRRDRSASHDELIEQLRYTQSKLTAAREQADELGTQERERLEAMRQHNAELLGESGFVQVTEPQPATKQIASGLATEMNSLQASAKSLAADQKKRAKQLQQFEGDASDLLTEPTETAEPANDDFSPEGLL
jgi:hypothetical protein